jgi:hypothetical protein
LKYFDLSLWETRGFFYSKRRHKKNLKRILLIVVVALFFSGYRARKLKPEAIKNRFLLCKTYLKSLGLAADAYFDENL